MSKNLDVHFSSKSNEWETPKEVFEFFNKQYTFDLDAAASDENKLCENFFCKEHDSLTQDWSQFKRIWVNPPYGRIGAKFMEKAYTEFQKGFIYHIIMLIPARTDTIWWHEFCTKADIYFIKGRLKFTNRSIPVDKKYTQAPFPSAIIHFNHNDERVIKHIPKFPKV